MTRIALLADRYPPDGGGLAVSARRIATGLAAGGHRVEVFAVTDRVAPGAITASDEGGLAVFRAGTVRREDDTTAALFDLVARRHAASPFDVLHGLYLVRAGFVAAYAGRYLGVRSVVSARGNDLDRAVLDPGRASRVLKALELADVVTGVSRELARKARALVPAARVAYVPNAVDAEAFAPVPPDPVRRRALALGGRAVVGFTGELRRKKGIVPLVSAMARLAASRPVTLLCVGGVRAEEEGVLALARREQPALQALVLPPCDHGELRRLYALMDVVVHPSLEDGMPNAVLEAMAGACPIVATPAGGIADLLKDGRHGLLVPRGDAAALADAIARLLDDRALAAALGAAARDRAARAFTPGRERRGYERLYRARRGGRRRATGDPLAPATM